MGGPRGAKCHDGFPEGPRTIGGIRGIRTLVVHWGGSLEEQRLASTSTIDRIGWVK